MNNITVSKASFVKIIENDGEPDLSFLGEYSNVDAPNAIDRQTRGDMRRNEFRYFIPAMTGEQTGNPNSPEEDYKRMEAYNKGEWGILGIRAQVTIRIRIDDQFILQVIESPGLWGIESDSDADYVDSVFVDECNTLTRMLTELGVVVTE